MTSNMGNKNQAEKKEKQTQKLEKLEGSLHGPISVCDFTKQCCFDVLDRTGDHFFPSTTQACYFIEKIAEYFYLVDIPNTKSKSL